MRIWLLGAAIGLLALALPMLPPVAGTSLVALIGIACALLFQRWARLVSGLLFGFAWGSYQAQILLDARLPDCVAGVEWRLVVEILDDPQALADASAAGGSWRFRARVLAADFRATAQDQPGECAVPVGSELRLAWYRSPPIGGGQRWSVVARIRPPWGYRNPGGFDFERWLLSQKLQGTGYVTRGNLLQPAPDTPVARYRERLRAALDVGYLAAGGALYALVSGDGSRITAEQWARFRATGTIHLMVVSGLHVGLVAALGYLLGNWLPRLSPGLSLWLPARRVGAVAGVAVSSFYVWFTGGGVPGLRALCMLAAAGLAALSGRRIRMGDLLLLALVAVLVLDPVAVHRQGLWLSFGAVLALAVFHVGRYQPRSWWRGMWSSQLALFIGLTPLLVALQGQVPLVGVLANLLAVPVMSLAVIPLVLLSAVLLIGLPELAGFGFYLADHILRWLLDLLDVLTGFAPLHVAVSPWLLVANLAAACLLLRGAPRRASTLLWLLWWGWCLPSATGVRDGEFRVIALDVGQGSSILVDTANHRLLFDAGPRFPSGFDLGAAVVVPSIVTTGPGRLDVMVISHADMDHRGGAQSVRAAVPVTAVFESEPRHDAAACVAGYTWRWDGVTFEFLSPSAAPRSRSDNDGSCVLMVANANERVLLPGDISAAVERSLLWQMRPLRLLIAPHHGSNTSSSAPFVRVSKPAVVFMTAGKHNRYRHPHAAVMARYRAVGADVYVTGLEGALIWESTAPAMVERFRTDRGAYWTGSR